MTTPTYRTLTEADTVQEGDEVQLVNTWEWFPVAHDIGGRGSSRYRRLVEQDVETLLDAMTKSWYDQRAELADAKISIVNLTKRLDDTLSDKILLTATLEDKEAVIRRLKEKLENVVALPTIDWKGHHYILKRQADANVSELQDKLAKAASYIEGLERDVVMLSNVVGEDIQIKDTLFFQISNCTDDEGCLSVVDAFPDNKVVFLPKGLNFHAAVQLK